MALGADDRMIDIELVDADPGDPAPPAGGLAAAMHRGARRRVPGRGRAVRRLLQALAVVVVLAVIVVTNVNERARDARRDAAVAAMPGLVATLDQPLDVVWERAGFGRVASGLVVDGVGGDPLSAATGEPIPLPIDDGEVRGPCGTVAGAEPEMLVCWHYEQVEPGGTASADLAEPTETARIAEAMANALLVAVGLDDGAVLGERPSPLPTLGSISFAGGWLEGFGSVDADLVVTTQEGRSLTTTRFDPLTGVERWTTRVDLPDDEPLGVGWVNTTVEVGHGYVVVHGPTTAVLSSDDGRQLGSWALPPAVLGEVRPLLDGADVRVTERGYAVRDGVEGGVRSPRGTWFGKDGREVDIEGVLTEPEVTDGSDGDVLLLARSNGTQLVGVDLATGEDLWTAGLRGGEVLMRRDGAVVVSDGRRLVAFDLRSGEERWSRPVEGIKPEAGSVTDGRTVVVVLARDHEWLLEAISLDGGEVSWTVPAPTPAPGTPNLVGFTGMWLYSVDGHVVLARPEATFGLS